MAANEEAVPSLLRRVYRAMTEEMKPASNIEEELSTVFSPFWCTAASFVQSTSELRKQWQQWKEREIKINFLEGNSAKESTHSISLLFIDYGTAARSDASCIRLTNSDLIIHESTTGLPWIAQRRLHQQGEKILDNSSSTLLAGVISSVMAL